MDFSWSEAQLKMRDSAVRFAEKELSEGVVERDQAERFSHDQWRACARYGILGLSFPKTYGGTETDILTTMLTMEGLGYGGKDNGLVFSLNAQMWSVQHPLQQYGTLEQKQRYLPGLIQGDLIGAHGMTEPEAGSDAYSLQTRAEKCDGGYKLTGHKSYITSAPVADLALLFAVTDPAKGNWGISAFLVEKGTPGFHQGQQFDKMGLRTAAMGELILEDCFVSEENRLGAEGMGARIFNSSMEWERSCILAAHIGAMERQLEECISFARERQQFGQPIGQFQAVSHRIAEMKVRLETARLLLYKVAWLKKEGKPANLEAAMAKLYLSEVFVESSMDAIRIHGGKGYLSQFEIERNLRDAVGGTIYSGTSDMQRNIIARLLGV
ncbi:MAG: acyl-CoA dehydrogenase family protein [Chloroflexota bacterium]